jgi:hypothetical protein
MRTGIGSFWVSLAVVVGAEGHFLDPRRVCLLDSAPLVFCLSVLAFIPVAVWAPSAKARTERGELVACRLRYRHR